MTLSCLRGNSAGLRLVTPKSQPVLYNTEDADKEYTVHQSYYQDHSVFETVLQSTMSRAHSGWGEVAYPPRHAPQYAAVGMSPTVGYHPTHLHPHQLPHHQSPHHPYYQPTAAAAAAAAAAAVVTGAPSVHMQHLIEQQAAEEMRKSAKRAANRRSASTCRARKKSLVENMAQANSEMRKRSRVLSLLPDMILAMTRDGVVTYASDNCRQFIKFTREEVQGANIFDIVESGSHNRLRRLLEENLGSVSKEAIASALRHQGTTFEDLLARSEIAKEQEDAHFFSTRGEAPQLFPGPVSLSGMKNSAAAFGGATSGMSKGCLGGGGRKVFSGSASVGTVEMDGSTDDWESEFNSSSTCEIGGSGISGCGINFGGASEADGTSPWRAKRALPHLRTADFTAERGRATASGEVTVKAKNETGAREMGRSGHTLSATAATAVSLVACKKAKEVDAARSYGIASESSGDGSITASQGVVSVDRDIQSKINAFNNNQKELCKLEIVRQDKKSDWYEVRSSMRLVWLKNKQEIVPVEVICSFQQMHADGPAGSANSIVARLQRAAAVGRSLSAGNNDSSDYLSGQSASSGFSASGDLSSEGDTSGQSISSNAGDSVSSSDYGGGASSDSLSGGGDGDSLDNDDESTRNDASSIEGHTREDHIINSDTAHSRKRSRVVSPPEGILAPFLRLTDRSTAQNTAPVDAQRATGRTRENSLGLGEEGGGGDAAGDQEGDSAVDTDEGTSAVTSQTSRILPPTAKRLAMSAKKTILLRHGFDSQNGARVRQG